MLGGVWGVLELVCGPRFASFLVMVWVNARVLVSNFRVSEFSVMVGTNCGEA